MRWLIVLLVVVVPVRADVPTKLKMRTPAHGGFVDDMDCSACHTTSGWKLAASAGASGFDHDRTGFPLRGQHTRTTCTGCHATTKPARTCEGCHRDVHEGRHDEPCAECHTAVTWSDVDALAQHRRTRMPLTGKHATLDCTACHTRQAGRTFSDTPADCYACHRDRFHDRAIHPTHDGSTGDPPFSRACGACHQTSAWTPAFTDPSVLRRSTADHDRVFVVSTGAHRGAACASCHVDTRRPALVRCDGCHDALSLRRQHRSGVRAGGAQCLQCHPRGARR
jgi:hypothetical protein